MPSNIVDTMTRNCRDARHRCRSRRVPVRAAERPTRDSFTRVGTTRSRTLTKRDRVTLTRRLDVDMA